MGKRDALQHRPTVIGLAAFVALALLTSAVMTNRLLASDGRFVRESAAESTTSPVPTPPASALPTAPPPSPDTPSVSISGVGDIIMGSANIGLPSNNATGFFDGVKQALAADVVSGNFEGTLSDDTGYQKCAPEATPSPTPGPEGRQTCYAFRMPPDYASRLSEGGFNVLNLANNHTNDFGPQGLRNTQQSLNSAGIEYTGMQNQWATLTTPNGITVAVLGFGPYGWMQKVTDISAARRLVERASAAADVVVVHMQAGAEGADKQHVKPGTEEFLGENRGDVVAFAHAVVEAGADVVVGHGPHVLRGMEWYQGRLIAYSVGNFAGYKTLSREYPSGTGAILRVTLARDGSMVAGSVVATKLAAPGVPALDEEKSAITQINELSQADFGDSGARLTSDGVIAVP